MEAIRLAHLYTQIDDGIVDKLVGTEIVQRAILQAAQGNGNRANPSDRSSAVRLHHDRLHVTVCMSNKYECRWIDRSKCRDTDLNNIIYLITDI